jgi:hypothetical protein
VRRTSALSAPIGLTLLLGVVTGCDPFGSTVATVSGVPTPPGAARIEVKFDPDRQTPSDCTVFRFSYVATRTGDTVGAPAGNVSAGVGSADASFRDVWCPGIETLTFPDRLDLMQGSWDVSLKVTNTENNEGLEFEGTCTGVPIRSGMLHVFLMIAPPAGTAAVCNFSL